MFVLYATTISATAYQADQTGVDTNHAAEVHAQPQSQRAAPYNPSTTKTNAKGNAPAKTAEPPIPLPSEPTTGVSSTHPAAAETNQALPPAPDKTTAPRQVDASGSPLPSEHIDQAGQPPTMTDTPVTPPAPEGRDQLDSPATPARQGRPAAAQDEHGAEERAPHGDAARHAGAASFAGARHDPLALGRRSQRRALRAPRDDAGFNPEHPLAGWTP